jgi:hypothetical protein
MTTASITFPRLPRDTRRIQTADRDVFVSMRIEQPEVALFDNLLSHEECDTLIALSRAKLKQSTIVDPQTGSEEVIQDRTSYGTFEGGGETIFPPLGLAITPKKGAAIYFEYVDDKGQVDEHTLHGGAPVTAGEKWIATKWMRAGKYIA